MDEDLGTYLKLGAAVAVPAFTAGSSGLIDPLLPYLVLGVVAGLVFVAVSFGLEGWQDARERRRTSSSAGIRTDSPLRVRLKEWGEVVDLWSKSALRISGAVFIICGGSGALGIVANKVVGG